MLLGLLPLLKLARVDGWLVNHEACHRPISLEADESKWLDFLKDIEAESHIPEGWRKSAAQLPGTRQDACRSGCSAGGRVGLFSSHEPRSDDHACESNRVLQEALILKAGCAFGLRIWAAAVMALR